MEQIVLIYFFKKIGFYIQDFARTYFLNGHSFLLKTYQYLFTKIEYRTGLIVNVRYFTIPLWQEYSIPAYLLSIPFRTFKIIIGAIILLLFTLIFALIYLCWALFPFYLIFKTIKW